MPEPSGSRTSMITRSGWKRRASSIASATVPGLGHDLELGPAVEQRDEALADDLVVVDDKQAQRAWCGGSGPVTRTLPRWTRTGSRTTTRRPAPGSLSIAIDGADRGGPFAQCWRDPGAPSRIVLAGIEARSRCRRSTSRPRPSSVDAQGYNGARRAGMADDVAERLADDPEQLAGHLGATVPGRRPAAPARNRSSRCGGTPRPARPGRRSARRLEQELRPEAEDEVADVLDREVDRVDRPVDAGASPRPGPRPSARARPRATGRRAYRLWMIPSWRSFEIRSRSSTTARRRTCSWSRAFSIAMPACRANVSTRAWSSSLNSPAPILSVRYSRPTVRPLTVIGTPRKLVIGGWLGGKP